MPLDLVVSVVSHGDAHRVRELLDRLADATNPRPARVVITWNIPEGGPGELADREWPFELTEIRNHQPKGFGANHNQALKGASERFVGVINPDVQWTDAAVFQKLLATAASDGVGCAYPVQHDLHGQAQDHQREVPSPAALWRRHVRKVPDRRIEWVNAACWVVPTRVWNQLSGFDEAYFLYCEDVDFCLRVRQAHLILACADAKVVHEARRASRRRWQHLVWHIQSLMRFWMSPVFRWAVGAGRREKQMGATR